MKKKRPKLSEEEVRQHFPIADLLAGWYFRVEETSACAYRVEGTDLPGRSVSLAGTDPARLLAESASAAAEFGGGYMTAVQVRAWIFLSVQEVLGSLGEIVGATDAINRAIPTHRELQGSLGWLIAQGLIRQEGRRYGLTAEGRALRESCGGRTIWGAREAVAGRLSEMGGDVAAPAEVSEDEVRAAYEGYRERMASALRKRGR